jgi:hypothetical protein
MTAQQAHGAQTQQAQTQLAQAQQAQAQQALQDAWYYLTTDCPPCAERLFDKARRLGATEEMIDAVRAEHAATRAEHIAAQADTRH